MPDITTPYLTTDSHFIKSTEFFIALKSSLQVGINDEQGKGELWKELLSWARHSPYANLTIRNLWQLTAVNRETREWALAQLADIPRPHVFGGQLGHNNAPFTAEQANQIEALNWSTMKWEIVGAMAKVSDFRGGEYRSSRFTATAVEHGVLVLGGETCCNPVDDNYDPYLDYSDDDIDDVPESAMSAVGRARRARVLEANGGWAGSSSFEILEYSCRRPGLSHDGAADHHHHNDHAHQHRVSAPSNNTNNDNPASSSSSPASSRAAQQQVFSVDVLARLIADCLDVRGIARLECASHGLLRLEALDESLRRRGGDFDFGGAPLTAGLRCTQMLGRMRRVLQSGGGRFTCPHANCGESCGLDELREMEETEDGTSGAEGTANARTCPACGQDLPPSCQPLPGRRALPSEIPTEALVTNGTSYDGSRFSHGCVELFSGAVVVVGGAGRLAKLPAGFFNNNNDEGDDDDDDDFDISAMHFCTLRSGFMSVPDWETRRKEPFRRAVSGGGRNVNWGTKAIAPMTAPRELFGCGVLRIEKPPNDPAIRFLRNLPPELVLVCGGYSNDADETDDGMREWGSSGATTAQCEIYDPAADSWWPFVAPMPQPRDNHGGVTLADGRFLATGGRLMGDEGRGYTASCCAFTFSAHGTLPADPAKRAQLAACASGAMDVKEVDTEVTAEEWKDFLTRGAWDADFPAMTEARTNHAVCLVQHGRREIVKGHAPDPMAEVVVAVGGMCNGHSAEMYDPQLGRWIALPCRTHCPRKFHAMAAIDVKGDQAWDEIVVRCARWDEKLRAEAAKKDKKTKKAKKKKGQRDEAIEEP